MPLCKQQFENSYRLCQRGGLSLNTFRFIELPCLVAEIGLMLALGSKKKKITKTYCRKIVSYQLCIILLYTIKYT